MLPFIPRLILAVLPNLAHHVPMIQAAANRTNRLLLNVIQSLPPPSESSSRQNTEKSIIPPSVAPGSPTPVPTATSSAATSRPTTASREPTLTAKDMQQDPSPEPAAGTGVPFMQSQRARASIAVDPVKITTAIVTAEPGTGVNPSRPESPMSTISVPQVQASPEASILQERDPFDYQATVNALTIQFLSEHEETRVAALKWLLMLHQKAPRKVRSPTRQ